MCIQSVYLILEEFIHIIYSETLIISIKVISQVHVFTCIDRLDHNMCMYLCWDDDNAKK